MSLMALCFPVLKMGGVSARGCCTHSYLKLGQHQSLQDVLAHAYAAACSQSSPPNVKGTASTCKKHMPFRASYENQ